MPYTVSVVSRRSFLQHCLAAGTGTAIAGCSSNRLAENAENAVVAPAPFPAERWALISDPHIAADVHATRGGANMAENLRHVVSEISSIEQSLAGAVVAGDCARLIGSPGDYATFHSLLTRPLTQAGTPVHLMLGNHDQREHFETSLKEFGATASSVAGKYVSIVRGPQANFFLLDSLDHTNTAPGRLGDDQLHWLDAALGNSGDNPAIVFGHHPIHIGGLIGFLGAMRDGEALWSVIGRHRHVVAYVFGHTHRWEITSRKGVHLLNLPSTAYVFDRMQPRGWVEMLLGNDGAQLRFHSIPGTEPSTLWRNAGSLLWRI